MDPGFRRGLTLVGLLVASAAEAAPGDIVTPPPPQVRGGQLVLFRAEGPGELTLELRVLMPVGIDFIDRVSVTFEDMGEVKGPFVQADPNAPTDRVLLRPKLPPKAGGRGTIAPSVPLAMKTRLAAGVHEYALRVGPEATYGALVSAKGAPLAREIVVDTKLEDDSPPSPPGTVLGKRPPALLGSVIDARGSIFGVFSNRMTGYRPATDAGGDVLLAENRLRLRASARSRWIVALATGELVGDAAAGEFEGLLREGYLDVRAGLIDLRLGRQLVSWGTGDRIFVNDVFPKDYDSFLDGHDQEFMRVPVDAARLSIVLPVASLEAIAIARFEADIRPDATRFLTDDPFPGVPRRYEEPEMGGENVEAGGRVHGTAAGVEWALYGFRGFDRRGVDLPAPGEVEVVYPRATSGGASVRTSIGPVVPFLEAASFTFDEPAEGTSVDPDDEVRGLAGVAVTYWRVTATAQYLLEVPMIDGEPDYELRREERFAFALDATWARGTWGASAFAWYRPRDIDFFIQPRVWHRTSNNMFVSAGANFFGGDNDHTGLGQLDKNDHAFVSVRYDF